MSDQTLDPKLLAVSVGSVTFEHGKSCSLVGSTRAPVAFKLLRELAAALCMTRSRTSLWW